VTSIQMPQLGETIIEGTILKWLKAEGDTIERDEPLFEISTDKVDTEVPSPVAGTVTKILVEEGATVPVGTELAEIDSGDAGTADSAGGGRSDAGASSDGDQASTGSQGGAEPPAAAPPAAASSPAPPAATSAAAPTPAPATVAASAAAPLPERGPRSQILSPLVRKMAAEHSIDLSQVAGTGTGGRITKQDVQAAIGGGGTSAPAVVPAGAPAATPTFASVPTPAVAGAGEEVVPMSKVRKLIAEHMHTSLQTSARAWNMVEVNF
jgi:pyruvate dehydrogenase E2 component (dihydrolipoamide acetyltransferase)